MPFRRPTKERKRRRLYEGRVDRAHQLKATGLNLRQEKPQLVSGPSGREYIQMPNGMLRRPPE